MAHTTPALTRTISFYLGVSPEDIIFVSDAEAELVAAREAGVGHTIMSIRPGKMPLWRLKAKSAPRYFLFYSYVVMMDCWIAIYYSERMHRQ